MSLTQGFCPKCGVPSENGELCGKCRVKDAVWVTIADRAECIVCPTCGSIKTAGIWSDVAVDKEELGQNLVNSVIVFHKDVEEIQKEISIIDTSSNRSLATVHVMGNLYGIALEESKKVKLVWAREQCDRCCRIAGSYYEGVIQVRASGRKPTQFELFRAGEIAYQIEDQLQTAGDRLSFVSDIDETKDGIDIIFGSQSIGASIAHDICGALGGSFTTHPKLVGQKGGINIYRVTYSLRLPRFSRGDIIKHGKEYFEIMRQSKDMLFVLDLMTGQSRAFREDESDPLLGNIHEPETGVVIYKDAGLLGILNLKTEVTEEVAERSWLDTREGDTILFFRDGETLVLVGRDEDQEDFQAIAPEQSE
ncbi:MAG: 60S ribosomal export protein NMD3 [Methanocorpusculum sp.]|jgi:nonsense-mediated mRNA decay protein 3|uniref:60S ribosomal export protein NMD3 n=1 Tax=Methanocorpusculum sp. TaxID=2058474 RepID=UPI0027191A93|nr:60S ribosomal export protein NMD3 [Methanocorpusculum sp.]MDO9523849.1 60S ribosomal export protein NMD3 [Methanocorpusculum sp.]